MTYVPTPFKVPVYLAVACKILKPPPPPPGPLFYAEISIV